MRFETTSMQLWKLFEHFFEDFWENGGDMMKSFSLRDCFFLSMTSECGLGKGNLKQPSQFHIISVIDTCSTPNSSLHIRFWSGMLTNQVYLAKPVRCFHMVYLDSSFLTLVIRAAIFSHQPVEIQPFPREGMAKSCDFGLPEPAAVGTIDQYQYHGTPTWSVIFG